MWVLSKRERGEYWPLVATLAALGILFVVLGAFVETARQVLFSLGGTGLFLAALTHYLFSDGHAPVSVCEKPYDAFVRLSGELVRERDSLEAHVYVPVDGSTTAAAGVELFLPKAYAAPESVSRTYNFEVDVEQRRTGLSITPIGSDLYADSEQMITDAGDVPLSELPVRLTETLIYGLELVEYATPLSETPDNEISIGITGPRFDPLDRFDHPVTSFLATGLAIGFDRPVAVAEIRSEPDRFDYIVTFTDASDVLGDR